MGLKQMLGLREREGQSTPEVKSRIEANWRNVSVVGESYYQPALWAAVGAENTGRQVAVECIAELVPEPDNPHDPKAIKVEVKGRCVGHLSRGVARRYGKRVRKMRAAGQQTICDAFIGGLVEGSDNPNLGITLKFPVDEGGDYRIQPGGAEIARTVLARRHES